MSTPTNSQRKPPTSACELGMPYNRLIGLIRFAIFDTPAKDSSGDYRWTGRELERDRQALAMRSQRTNSREVAL